MGSGGSRHLRITNAKATAFSRHPEYPIHKSAQPKMPQEQWLSRDREDDECSEESLSQKDVERDVSQSSSQEGVEWDVAQSSSQEDVERDVSHTSTLRRYQMNYPEQGEDFQKVFENMQVLRNTMNNSSTGSDQHSKNVATAAHNLLAICDDIDTSTGDVASKKMRVLDLAVEIEAAQLLQRFAQNYFKDFYEMGGELEDDNNSSEDESWDNICVHYLRLVLGAIQNSTDLHDGFCSASAKAGVVPMCLQNIVCLDSIEKMTIGKMKTKSRSRFDLLIAALEFCITFRDG